MSRAYEDQPEAGPSTSRQSKDAYRVPLAHPVPEDELITIPSIGLEYFHYRRALFLAGQEPYSLPHPLPAYIMVPRPPPPLPLPSSSGGTKPSATAKLEKMLEGPGAQDNMMMRRKVAEVERVMKAGRKLVKGTSLSLVIKILKYGWIQDGLWPIDPKTGNPAIAPDSPIPSDPSPLPEFGMAATSNR